MTSPSRLQCINFYRQPSHSEKRKPADLLERGLIAVFLLRCLDRAKFFENAEFLLDDANTTIEDVKDYVGGLLLRHLQSVAVTAFSINELQVNRFCRDITVYSRIMFTGR